MDGVESHAYNDFRSVSQTRDTGGRATSLAP
jgi:hypothetical protein